MEFFVVVLLAAGGLIYFNITQANKKARELAEAKASYHGALGKLKQDPTNADLKQQTLALGRRYSNLTRDAKGVTLFDEVALSNDIGAACAAAARHSPSGVAQSPESRLSKLADLKARGLIDGEEYQAQRVRILQDL